MTKWLLGAKARYELARRRDPSQVIAAAPPKLLRTIKHGQHSGRVTMPEDDPDLRDTWADMTPTERLAYMVREDESPPPELSQQVRQMYRDRQAAPEDR